MVRKKELEQILHIYQEYIDNQIEFIQYMELIQLSHRKNLQVVIYDGENVRKLTLNECYRIMGFKNFKRCNIVTEAYKQIGNSVAIPVVQAIAKEIKNQGML
ncbi:MAG: DNA cytosine methyltransferase [Candidatus Marithrix sp.]